MASPSRSPILSGWRFAPNIAFVAAALIIIVGVLAVFYEERNYRNQKLLEADVQAHILSNTVSAALVFRDPMTAQGFLTALSENPEVDAAGVYDSAGAPFAGFMRPGSAPLPARVSDQASYYDSGRVVATIPIIQNGMQIGAVYLRQTTDSVARRIVRYGGIIMLVILAVLVMAGVGFSHRLLSRTNAALAMQTREVNDINRKLLTEMEERAKAEQALRQAQKMEAVGQLSGGIAHDFNNLIMIAKGNLSLMERRIAQGKTDVQRYTGATKDALNRAAAITERILAFARKQSLSPKSVALSTLVTGLDDLLRHSLGPNVELQLRLQSDWLTLCDPNQMENVIINLAINARDAMPQGGRLTIETSNLELRSAMDEIVPGEYVELVVRDTGTGMPEDVRVKAIDPFFTTKPVGQGTGLGLSVAFGYVRQSNGYLTIESAVSKGTAVRILMPRQHVERLPVSA